MSTCPSTFWRSRRTTSIGTKEMQLIPGAAMKCDFMHFMVKSFVSSCTMMIEVVTSSSNLVVVFDSTGWSMLEPYMDSWYKLSFRLVWSQWPYYQLPPEYQRTGGIMKISLWRRWSNILHPLTCYWSGHYKPERRWLRPFDLFQDVAKCCKYSMRKEDEKLTPVTPGPRSWRRKTGSD